MNKLEKLDFILNILCKRYIPAYLYSKNPDLFLKWQGNCCKQCSIISSYYADIILENEYIIQSWEGIFINNQNIQYNHCWNYFIHRPSINIGHGFNNIICDFTSSINYMNFGPNNPEIHIKSMLNNQFENNTVNNFNIKIIKSEKIDWKTMLLENEYYTGLKGSEIIKDLDLMLQKSNLKVSKTSLVDEIEYEEIV